MRPFHLHVLVVKPLAQEVASNFSVFSTNSTAAIQMNKLRMASLFPSGVVETRKCVNITFVL